MTVLSQSLRPLVTRLITVLFLLPICAVVGARAQTTAGSGRVIVTITLESLRVSAVNVEILNVDGNIVLGRTTTDAVGQAVFPDVPAGRYVVRAIREGFADAESSPFEVRGGATEQVLVEMRLTFVRESVEVVVPANSPTESLQPVAVSDVLTGAKMDIQPLAGDDFQSLLTVLPSIIRGPDGRLRIKGGAPTTGALQISSASLNDPSTGDFDLELPSGAVESVEVLSNPFAAEYGRFSTSVTQVRTRRGTNDWIVKPDNLLPGFGKGCVFVEQVRAAAVDLRPAASATGYCSASTCSIGSRAPRCRACPGARSSGSTASIRSRGSMPSSRRATRLTGGVIYFPRKITNPTLSTFRPAETTPTFTQEGFSAGLADRLILSARTPCSNRRSPAAFSKSTRRRGRRADGLRATDTERGVLQPARSATSAACKSSRRWRSRRIAGRPARLQGRRGLPAFPLRRREPQPAARRRAPRRLARGTDDLPAGRRQS